MSDPNTEAPVEIDPADTEWELDNPAGSDPAEELNPDDPDVLAARRAAGDPTVPEEASA